MIDSRDNIASVAIKPLLREGEGVSLAGLHIAASSYIRIEVLFSLPLTRITCIDYRENLVDFSNSLMLGDDTSRTTRTSLALI